MNNQSEEMNEKEKEIKIEINADPRDTKTEMDQEETQSTDGTNYLGELKRIQAEFINYKRRTQEEWARVGVKARCELLKKFLPVLDDFERFIEHHPENDEGSGKGMSLILQKFRKVFQEEGVVEISALGNEFDPEQHQAVCAEPVDPEKDNIILEEWQKGYRLGDCLLRPSQVKVGQCQASQEMSRRNGE